MQVKTINDLFLMELQDLYSVENQIIEAMPKMIEKTTSPELKRAFTVHLEETRNQQQLVEDLCLEFTIDPMGHHCLGMEGILEEAAEVLTANTPSPVLDLALIASAQKVEHYEIASYGTTTNYAQELGYEDAQDLLVQILAEEKTTDEKLTALAEALLPDALQYGSTQVAA